MNYLTDKHKQLSESQQSGLMLWFGRLPMDKKAVAIGLSLTVGISSAAMAWKGESSDRIYFCVRTPQKKLVCQDKNNRPFRMTPYYWEQWKLEGMPTQIVRDPAMGVNGLVKATNPCKPFWAFGGFLGFALAGWMLRHCQEEEKQRAVFEDIAQKRDAAKAEMAARSELLESYRDVAIAEVQLQADLDLVANDRTVDIQKAEIYAHTEIEVTQMEATDAIFEAQTAGMTEEQKAEYIKQLREMKTPYLQGSQTLAGTIDPNDKVTGDEQGAIAPGATPTGDYLHPSEPLALNTLQALARADSSTALVAAPGSGKSVTLNYLIQKILADSPMADIWVISAKNDSFCGLREKGRVIVFDGENPDLAKEIIDSFYTAYKKRKQLPESKRESLPPLILILDDWLVIADSLSKLYSDWNYGSKLLDVLLIGREFNTKFIASLQSFNLAALGIEKMDAQTRICLNLLLLGNRYIKNGREQESYGVLELILNRGDIIPGKLEREQIKSKYLDVKAVSYQNLRPVMIASVGGFVVALMPLLSNKVNSIASEQEYLDRVFDLEFNLNPAHNGHSKPLSEVAKKIYEYFQNVKTKTPKTLRDLKKADRLSGYSEPELIDGLAELVKTEKINSDGNDSYSLPDW
ncbi:hypothetical protein NIES4072_74090 [Nostoc commune NIES-4072]|uniref:Uncharacterized protein n=1 Tax=Nostoc commune NIES-4072 TaxID=2005467 RepID=A0A2R5FY60_NOSCO|nr:type IV secretory system conjugative DNA transfer family protein [Nostoc commune]BBD70997.1 hypothetical protein NIES4070_74080 [Nostoc commune HK-02]GBG23697.1 hypothetical protein NIES4072_74090 [Nostoc commune NIES-4072]